MGRWSDAVADHYTVPDLGNRILEALKSAGKDPDALAPDDLAAVDEIHIRGREATEGLARIAAVESGTEILDVGCGIGGSSRYLAAAFGCYVTGVDVTEEFCKAATMLSQRVGLDEATEFRRASAEDMPFPNESFDLVWTEHAQMNIQDKDALFAEIARVLKRGGTLAFHDVFAGPGGPAHLPVPWADDPSINFLMDPEELRLVLHSLKFETRHWEDVTDESLTWFTHRLSNAHEHGLPPAGPQLLMGENTITKFENLVKNLEQQRIVVVQGVLRKGGAGSLGYR